MTIAPRSERRRGLFVLQLARAGGIWGATTKKREIKEIWRFFFKHKAPLKLRRQQRAISQKRRL